jgi:hypothetical protein
MSSRFVYAERVKRKSVEPKVYAIYLSEKFSGSSLELVVAYSLEEAFEKAHDNTRIKFQKDGMPKEIAARLHMNVDLWQMKTVQELFDPFLSQSIEKDTKD